MDKKNKIKIQNPILPGFNPDPSIIRVDSDYYIAVSTFEWFPGIRIYHSKDMANWEYLTAPLTNIDMADLRGVSSSDGIWAPALSYSDGYFYIIYTVVHGARAYPPMDTPNYLIRSRSINGPWSRPVYLNSSGFDPSLFHDNDGRKWLVNMEWDYRKVGNGNPFTGIILQEYDVEKEILLESPRKIFKGTELGSLEAPIIYKKDGYYYLFSAEGGTGWFHAVTVARSTVLEGPYEIHPSNPLLTSWEGGNDASNFPKEFDKYGIGSSYLKKAGHGSLCSSPDGQWYLAHLCSRPLPGTSFCILGRESAIQEIEWKNGWPYLSDGGHFPKEYYEVYSDTNPHNNEKDNLITYKFFDESFLKDFQTLRIPYDESYITINERKGFLRMYGRESIFSRFYQSLIARRQTDFSFNAGTKFEFNPTSFQHSAGLIYRYDENHQYYLYVSYDDEENSKVINLCSVIAGEYKELESKKINGNEFELSIEVKESKAQFLYKEQKSITTIGPVLNTSYLSDDYANGFTGTFIGICVQDLQSRKQYADFNSFFYNKI